MTIQVTSVLPKDQLTEREVLAAARSIRELRELRLYVDHEFDADICLYQGGVPSNRIGLEKDERAAVIALLIERHTTMLASLGVTPEAPAK